MLTHVIYISLYIYIIVIVSFGYQPNDGKSNIIWSIYGIVVLNLLGIVVPWCQLQTGDGCRLLLEREKVWRLNAKGERITWSAHVLRTVMQFVLSGELFADMMRRVTTRASWNACAIISLDNNNYNAAVISTNKRGVRRLHRRGTTVRVGWLVLLCWSLGSVLLHLKPQ